jgi:hypothetical protein
VLSTPISVASQTYGASRGLSEGRFKRADEALAAAARECKVQPLLRSRFLAHATNSTGHAIVEVVKPFPKGQEAEYRQMGCVMSGTLAWVPAGQTPQYYLESQNIQTVLELEILDPALTGKGELNPPMSFSARVRASLWTVRDGQELASCELRYNGPAHQFTTWSRDDARLFREEIAAFADAVSAAIVQRFSLPLWEDETRPMMALQAVKP